MNPQFRPVRRQSVMCTVQGCAAVATFVSTGDPAFGGRPVMEAYCDRHAAEAAARIAHPSPVAESRSPDQPARSRVFRAG